MGYWVNRVVFEDADNGRVRYGNRVRFRGLDLMGGCFAVHGIQLEMTWGPGCSMGGKGVGMGCRSRAQGQ